MSQITEKTVEYRDLKILAEHIKFKEMNITVDSKYYVMPKPQITLLILMKRALEFQKFYSLTIKHLLIQIIKQINNIDKAVREIIVAKYWNILHERCYSNSFSRKILMNVATKLSINSASRYYFLVFILLLNIKTDIPNYSSALIIELHKEMNVSKYHTEEYYVKFFYRNTNTNNCLITEIFIFGIFSTLDLETPRM
ncbi:hypothetical protein A3Q56_06075 [Intoshia linei]|uniref:Uncharacterized protein n=1 Tax=Intoshia linei TaxID=1819745 RepID=A0A177AXV2_9BILA|nr:hypothetical protein A3Q56_06075 [Intoshia linei]